MAGYEKHGDRRNTAIFLALLADFPSTREGCRYFAVPDLTFCADIKLNERVSLHLQRKKLRYSMKTGITRFA